MCNNDESNHAEVINRWCQINEDIDTHRNIPFLPTGSSVAVKWEDAGPWTHGTVVDKSLNYKINVMQTRCSFTRENSHVIAIPVSVIDYIRKEILKANRLQTDDKLI